MLASRTLMSTARSPVRLILFDAFDTLITPRLPIHVQYAEEASKAGLKVGPEEIKQAFKPAFKSITAKHPEWGRTSSPPMDPAAWWTLLIEECMRRSGVAESELRKAMPTLGPALLQRFESRQGYRTFDDVEPCLRRLKELGIPTGLVSNADDRILKTLQSLNLLPDHLTAGTTISQHAGCEKPDRKIFEQACRTANVDLGEGVIMVGDELEADYRGAIQAGLEARLIRRPGGWSEGAKRETEEVERLREDGVDVIRDLSEVIKEVERRNSNIRLDGAKS